ncbi:hypothetical protein FDZ84_13270 [Saccharopolyspora sp. ASAGF58]|nr:hypothetical protein FDZ84_13270 [Saccharopolyspora sp. ASAGF58]
MGETGSCGRRLGQGLAVLWWCWCCYAWLGNTVHADRGIGVCAVLGALVTFERLRFGEFRREVLARS